MKLLIAGSRTITNYSVHKSFLHSFCVQNGVTGIISGGAKGADTIARFFAEDYNMPFVEIKPEWDRLGKRAGFVRNQFLVDYCDYAILLWDGVSKGTAHTISLLKKANKAYTIIEVNNMPKFGTNSSERLASADPRLQALFNEVIKTFDCTVLEGHRTKEKQDEYFKTGKSKLPWPEGKHCADPSLAVDVAPFINGAVSYNTNHCLYFAGYVMATAEKLGINIRWGGDWDMDNEAMTDQTFQDLLHYEIK